MATLEWRSMNSPNFSGNLEGLRLFGNMVGNATGGLSDALGNFQKAQQVDAQQRAMTTAQGFTDPAAYQAALASGQVTQGIDPSLLTPAALESLQGRTGKLTEQAVAMQGLEKDRYTSDRIKADNALVDAARPDIAAMIQTNLGKALPQSVAALPPSVLATFATSIQGLDRAAMQNQNLRTEADLAKQQREARQAADQAAQTDFPSILNADSARKYLMGSTLPVETKKLVQAQLESQFGPLFGPVTASGAPAATGTVPSGSAAATTMLSNAAGPVPVGGGYDTVVGNQKSSKPLTQMTVGEVIAEGKSNWIPATRGNASLGLPADKGSSAAGRYQITGETLQEFGKKVYGDGWDSQPFSPEVQDKVAEAIFNARKGGDLTSTWVGLKSVPGASTPGAYKDKSWAEVKDLIAQKESGGSPAAALTAAAQPVPTQRSLGAASDALGLAAIQNRAGNFYTDRLRKAVANDTSSAQITNQMTSGDYKGINPVMLESAIEETARKAETTPAVAAEMVIASLDRQNGFVPFILGGSGTHTINEKKLKQEIDRWSAAGGPREVLRRERDINLTGQELTTATAAYDSARANLTAARNRAESVPAVAAQLPALEAEVAKKQASLMLAQKAIQDKKMQGSVNVPAVPPPVGNSGDLVSDALNKISSFSSSSQYTPPVNSPAGQAAASRESVRLRNEEKQAAAALAKATTSAQFQSDAKELEPLALLQKYDPIRGTLGSKDAARLREIEKTL